MTAKQHKGDAGARRGKSRGTKPSIAADAVPAKRGNGRRGSKARGDKSPAEPTNGSDKAPAPEAHDQAHPAANGNAPPQGNLDGTNAGHAAAPEGAKPPLTRQQLLEEGVTRDRQYEGYLVCINYLIDHKARTHGTKLADGRLELRVRISKPMEGVERKKLFDLITPEKVHEACTVLKEWLATHPKSFARTAELVPQMVHITIKVIETDDGKSDNDKERDVSKIDPKGTPAKKGDAPTPTPAEPARKPSPGKGRVVTPEWLANPDAAEAAEDKDEQAKDDEESLDDLADDEDDGEGDKPKPTINLGDLDDDDDDGASDEDDPAADYAQSAEAQAAKDKDEGEAEPSAVEHKRPDKSARMHRVPTDDELNGKPALKEVAASPGAKPLPEDKAEEAEKAAAASELVELTSKDDPVYPDAPADEGELRPAAVDHSRGDYDPEDVFGELATKLGRIAGVRKSPMFPAEQRIRIAVDALTVVASSLPGNVITAVSIAAKAEKLNEGKAAVEVTRAPTAEEIAKAAEAAVDSQVAAKLSDAKANAELDLLTDICEAVCGHGLDQLVDSEGKKVPEGSLKIELKTRILALRQNQKKGAEQPERSALKRGLDALLGT